jgi:hypothetical protein
MHVEEKADIAPVVEQLLQAASEHTSTVYSCACASRPSASAKTKRDRMVHTHSSCGKKKGGEEGAEKARWRRRREAGVAEENAHAP